jgi:hypothetical protein
MNDVELQLEVLRQATASIAASDAAVPRLVAAIASEAKEPTSQPDLSQLPAPSPFPWWLPLLILALLIPGVAIVLLFLVGA